MGLVCAPKWQKWRTLRQVTYDETVGQNDDRETGNRTTSPRVASAQDTSVTPPPDAFSSPTLLPSDDPSSDMRHVPQRASEPRASSPSSGTSGTSPRYLERSVLGEGGMGIVRLGHDPIIGRDVAIKTIRKDRYARPDLQARFLREARVQGRLEHPSIVPVYDMGTDADGATYFTMRRVNGVTLGSILEKLGKGDSETREKFSRHRLLSAFGSVCLTIDFAHERGVIHRDLKPGNVMIGDYGEVYVLDWGVAKVADSPDWQMPATDAETHATHAGSYVGTLGYMAPEQLSGTEIDRRVDVYALGALLFEILTYTPLHSGSPPEMTATTLIGVEARPSVRTPDLEVPPELEAICVRATATKSSDRYPTARALSDDLQKYLDGDRELERRRELSVSYSEQAKPRAALALGDEDPTNEAREQAMRDVGNALALDPENRSALRTMTRLMLHPPRKTPPDALLAMKESRFELMRVTARMGAFVFSMWFAWLPILGWMGIRSWASVVVASLAFGAALVLCLLDARKAHEPKDERSAAILLLACVGFGALTRLFGPLVLLPTALFGFSIVYVQNHFRPSLGTVAFASGIALMVLPTLLEYFGVLSPSYAFEQGGIRIVANMASFPREGTLLFLLVANVVIIGSIWRLTRRLQRALADAEIRVVIQSWHLRLMVPEEARHAVRAPTVKEGKVTLQQIPASLPKTEVANKHAG